MFPLSGPGGGYGVPYAPLRLNTFLLMILGVAAFTLPFFAVARRYRSPALRRPAETDGDTPLYAAAVALLAVNALFEAVDWRVPVAYQMVTNLKPFAVIAVRHLQIRGRLAPASRAVGWAAILLVLTVGAGRQLWTPLALTLIALALVELLNGRRIWILLGVLLVGLAALYPLRRSVPPVAVQAICLDASPVAPFFSFPAAFVRCHDNTARLAFTVATAKWSFETVVRRLSANLMLDRVVDFTPRKTPYLNGETLKPLAWILVPRPLYPDKPREATGQLIGHKYRLINPDDAETSMNLPWITELYANFGIPGIAGGMLLLGALIGAVTSIADRPGAPLRVRVLVMGVTLPLAYPESNISLMLGNAIHGGVGGFLLLTALAVIERRAATDRKGAGVPQ